MHINIDSAIFIGFLLINLAVGLFYSRGIKNIREYAIGNQNFSTATIASTIAATWIGGGVLSQTITETYKQGLYFIIPALGDSLVLLVITPTVFKDSILVTDLMRVYQYGFGN